MNASRFPALLCLATALALVGQARADSVVNFQDLNLAPDSYENGVDLSGGFTSGGAFFKNTYYSSYGGNTGWSYTNVNDVVAASKPDYTYQYEAIAQSGAKNPINYGIVYADSPADSFINLPPGMSASSFQVTNTAYAYESMLNGDGFAKKFGAGDYFKLSIFGYTGLGGTGIQVGGVDFYLANYTSAASLPVSTWTTVGLSSLAGAASLSFSLSSSDVGQFGINTPLYFAMDNLALTAVPEPSSLILVAAGLLGLAGHRASRRRA